jgi:hypothetical protein
MSFDTCDNCCGGVDKPSEEEILEDNWRCTCGHELVVGDDLLREVLRDMLTRIRVLEGRE